MRANTLYYYYEKKPQEQYKLMSVNINKTHIGFQIQYSAMSISNNNASATFNALCQVSSERTEKLAQH